MLLTLDLLEGFVSLSKIFFVIHSTYLNTIIYTYIQKSEDDPIKFFLFQLLIVTSLSVNYLFLTCLIISNFLSLILRKNNFVFVQNTVVLVYCSHAFYFFHVLSCKLIHKWSCSIWRWYCLYLAPRMCTRNVPSFLSILLL